MSAKKKQHFVPRFYLKRFADENGLLDIYQVDRSEIHRDVDHKDQCQKSYFYGTDLDWENRLGEMESDWCSLFSKIDKRTNLTDEDLNKIKLFALFQRQRTSGEFKYRYNERLALYELYARKLYAYNGWKFDDEAVEQIKEYVNESISPAEMLELALNMQKHIEDLAVHIIEYSTNRHFIISDVPVIAINPFHMYSIGYGCAGLVILFPISPTVLAVIYDSKMYRSNDKDIYSISSNEDELTVINNLQFVSAEEILLGNEEDFPNPDADLIDARTNSRNDEYVTCLGTDENQLWVTSMRKTLYPCELSFAHVNHSFRRVPFICLEAVPRKWEKEYEIKLKNKAKILSAAYSCSPETFQGYTIKDIREGCDRFYREMLKYWGDTKTK